MQRINKKVFVKRQKNKTHKNMRGFLWILPSFLGVMVFYLLPYADVVRRSFLGAVDSRFVGLLNYKTVLENTAFRLAVKNTFLFTLVCIPVLIIVALLCAVTLYKSKYGRIIKSAFLMPMALPAVSVALVWRLLFHSQGLLNHWLSGPEVLLLLGIVFPIPGFCFLLLLLLLVFCCCCFGFWLFLTNGTSVA